MGDGFTLARLDWPAVTRATDRWERLRPAAPTETIFLTPDWLETWWRHLGPPGRPSLLVIEENCEAHALAPLYRAPIGVGGLVALRPLGLGVSDYLDLLLPTDGATRRACLEALLNGLLAHPSGWDALDLLNVPGESPTADELPRLARSRGLPCAVLPAYLRPAIDLHDNWGAYLKSRPGRFRYNLRSRLRRLGRHGHVGFRSARDPDEVRAGLPELVRLHARRWLGQRTATIFSSSPRGRAFYAEACRRYAARGLLDLTFLEVDGRPVAGSLGLVERGTFYYYMPAWEPELSAYAPSSLLLAHLIERAHAAGIRRFDFMLGDEPYKAQWANEHRRTVRVIIGNRGLSGRAAFGLLVAGHRLRQRARASAALRDARRFGVARAIRDRVSAFRG